MTSSRSSESKGILTNPETAPTSEGQQWWVGVVASVEGGETRSSVASCHRALRRLLESFQQKRVTSGPIHVFAAVGKDIAKPGPVRSSFNNPFMMQMFVEGLECARLCSDSGDKNGGRKREFVLVRVGESEVGGSENQLPTQQWLCTLI